MSLIITSNRLPENSGTARGQLGTENPSDYKNFFRSPIEIEPDSEIAVESVKVERAGNIQLNDNSYFCHYWGRDEGADTGVGPYEDLNQISRNIPLKRGTYNFETYQDHIEERMDAQYGDPRIYGSNSVTWRTNASTGVPEGLNIRILQRGSASGTDETSNLTAQTVYNIQTPNNEEKLSDEYSWTDSTGVIAKTGAFQTQFSNASAVVQLKGRPFGLNQGRFDVSVVSASTQRWAVGLSRPQIQYRSQAAWNANLDDMFNLDRQTEQHQRSGRKIIDADGDEFFEGPWETYDYAVIQSEGVGQSEIMVVQRAYDDITGLSRMEELDYWNVPGGIGGSDRMNYSAFYASFDGVRFEGVGDEVKLYFKQKGKSVYTQVLGSNLEDKPGRSFTPIGDTSNALYPMFNLGAGSMTVTKFESNFTSDIYRYPTFTTTNNIFNTYTPGDDMFSNQAPVMRPGVLGPFSGIPSAPRDLKPSSYSLPAGRELVNDNVVGKIDSSGIKYLWTDDANDVATYGYVGIADNGVQFDHILTMNELSETSAYNTLMPSQKLLNMSGKLGYPARSLAIQTSNEGYVDGDGTRDITFRSPSAPSLVTKSAFIRLPNLTHTSYNGAQSSISKIVYQVPQFTNDGRQFGPLFFAPGEKTYIALKNPSKILLNDLSVQFVEANEKVVDSFTGSSQVVFHIRKRK
jgi:hypothetical protein